MRLITRDYAECDNRRHVSAGETHYNMHEYVSGLADCEFIAMNEDGSLWVGVSQAGGGSPLRGRIGGGNFYVIIARREAIRGRTGGLAGFGFGDVIAHGETPGGSHAEVAAEALTQWESRDN